jgi:hypothetical protein
MVRPRGDVGRKRLQACAAQHVVVVRRQRQARHGAVLLEDVEPTSAERARDAREFIGVDDAGNHGRAELVLDIRSDEHVDTLGDAGGHVALVGQLAIARRHGLDVERHAVAQALGQQVPQDVRAAPVGVEAHGKVQVLEGGEQRRQVRVLGGFATGHHDTVQHVAVQHQVRNDITP